MLKRYLVENTLKNMNLSQEQFETIMGLHDEFFAEDDESDTPKYHEKDWDSSCSSYEDGSNDITAI